MSRHRNVRNYAYEEDMYDDVYGHSVEEHDLCVSPTTAQQFLFRRGETQHPNLSSFMEESLGYDEEDNTEDREECLGAAKDYTTPKLDRESEAKLASCMDEFRSILGDHCDEQEATAAILKHNFDLERAIDDVLSNGGNQDLKSHDVSKKEKDVVKSGSISKPLSESNIAASRNQTSSVNPAHQAITPDHTKTLSNSKGVRSLESLSKGNDDFTLPRNTPEKSGGAKENKPRFLSTDDKKSDVLLLEELIKAEESMQKSQTKFPSSPFTDKASNRRSLQSATLLDSKMMQDNIDTDLPMKNVPVPSEEGLFSSSTTKARNKSSGIQNLQRGISLGLEKREACLIDPPSPSESEDLSKLPLSQLMGTKQRQNVGTSRARIPESEGSYISPLSQLKERHSQSSRNIGSSPLSMLRAKQDTTPDRSSYKGSLSPLSQLTSLSPVGETNALKSLSQLQKPIQNYGGEDSQLSSLVSSLNIHCSNNNHFKTQTRETKGTQPTSIVNIPNVEKSSVSPLSQMLRERQSLTSKESGVLPLNELVSGIKTSPEMSPIVHIPKQGRPLQTRETRGTHPTSIVNSVSPLSQLLKERQSVTSKESGVLPLNKLVSGIKTSPEMSPIVHIPKQERPLQTRETRSTQPTSIVRIPNVEKSCVSPLSQLLKERQSLTSKESGVLPLNKLASGIKTSQEMSPIVHVPTDDSPSSLNEFLKARRSPRDDQDKITKASLVKISECDRSIPSIVSKSKKSLQLKELSPNREVSNAGGIGRTKKIDLSVLTRKDRDAKPKRMLVQTDFKKAVEKSDEKVDLDNSMEIDESSRLWSSDVEDGLQILPPDQNVGSYDSVLLSVPSAFGSTLLVYYHKPDDKWVPTVTADTYHGDIIPFDFNTPSPDDIVLSKQKNALGRKK